MSASAMTTFPIPPALRRAKLDSVRPAFATSGPRGVAVSR